MDEIAVPVCEMWVAPAEMKVQAGETSAESAEM